MHLNEHSLSGYEVCIVGAGPAGIITALEYNKLHPGKKVALVEFGREGSGPENKLDSTIVINDLLNHHEPHEVSNKGFGGTSATWGGRCVSYDAIDFEDRPVVNGHCTWDASIFTSVKPYYSTAAEYFECGEAKFNLAEIAELQDTHIAENFVEGIVTDGAVERWSMPTRFGTRYKHDIQEATNIDLLTGLQAHEFVTNKKGDVTGLVCINDLEGNRVRIEAAQFVIAAGAQESTRLLLLNQHLFTNLPAGTPKALGKYYQGHVSGKIASVKFYGDPKKTDFGFMRDKDGIYLRRRFQFSDKFLLENDLLNTAIWLDNPLYHDPAHGSGAMSFMYLAMITPVLGKKLAPPAIARSVTKGQVTGVGKHIWNVIRQLPVSVIKPATIFYKRYLLKRKLPGIFLYSPENIYALHFHAEQQPDERNSMYLAEDGNTLVINYGLTDRDIRSVIDVHKALDKYLRDINCGELRYWFHESEMTDAIRKMSKDGIHQAGTTRMANSPELGVTDIDLKVFGTSNLYVCSSSVFPTSGQANPTFLLGAFAVRLAKHLSSNTNA